MVVDYFGLSFRLNFSVHNRKVFFVICFKKELKKMHLVMMLQNIDKIVLKTNEKMQKEVNALFEKQEKFKE